MGQQIFSNLQFFSSRNCTQLVGWLGVVGEAVRQALKCREKRLKTFLKIKTVGYEICAKAPNCKLVSHPAKRKKDCEKNNAHEQLNMHSMTCSL